MLQSNEYFSGKVKSIGFSSSSTARASVGVMVEGEYTFSTAEPEEMTVISGALNVLLPDATDWQVYEAGSVFNVPGHSEFHLQVAEPTSYLCRYL
ncbi:pyrimidine/purine nucleoside phosphorylase [Escherichia coli]|uniref:pyrimidine/purine nucleoside phosphorylase n=1 Tax=Escherichia coli TaxID=562 RepID=UPI00132A87A8|nr:pyrimidine/purine nucleoside phosphorylase [Escherichia coli]MBE9876011.1 pyrimidine/purine nucleoside phosphorylase [Escherichia coli]MWN35042.1 pyrimidine/purine nucleoside phosphorylase [Escherichia coli]MWN53736.1 pyrimidine/purine nucleoside phosphorylase [Escherichia coli]MWN57255.1 pyrimidine/purine nucleoside phosphorylase [Escherichia coli]MWN67144.1 pyrimidine/purine nucleoside phosphorylase [Escherichia coli]